ncbi:bile acid germinant receptor pseudoprotease CspC [Romboutsia maritimum]|nr:bile acid germinant receptor pseudoprotease CspC [Romboutsia maritimum]
MNKNRISEKSYFIIYQGDIEKALKENGINEFMVLNSKLAVIYVPLDFNEAKLNDIVEVAWWNESIPMSSLIDITNNLETGETVTRAAGTEYVYNNPYINISGKGIIIAVIDSGIDYLHPDFIKDDGTSKIISIWDQESDKGNIPEGFIFGSEFSNSQINEAIKENNGSLSVDNIGTGTIAAGILVGGGRINPLYKGVAVGAELVVVKLRQYVGTFYKDKINYTSTDFYAAITYVLSIAKVENKPIIINFTIGGRSGTVLDASMIDTYDSFSKAGVVVVSGAGNQGNTDVHFSGSFSNVNQSEDIIIQVSEDYALDIILNTRGPDKIDAMLVAPSGEMSKVARYSPDYYVYSGKFNLEDTLYEMRYIYPWIGSGKEHLEIKLNNLKPGIWTLRLMPEFIINGNYDVYLPNKDLLSDDTRFLDPDSVATVTVYGANDGVITVGTYNDKTDSMWLGSSKGPIEGRGIKPDIVAPGIDIISTYLGRTYNTGSGTGISSSIVCGILALIMEYMIQQTELSRLSLYTETLKTYLMLGSTKKEIYTYPNISQGYGIVNLKNTIQQISNIL